MKQFGLIGEKLGHSHSKTLHGLLADYCYDLWPMPKEDVDGFMRSSRYDGMNVTIPYKQTVIPYLSAIGDTAKRIGAVNTIVRRSDGTLYGDNTDFFGMMEMARRAGISFAHKKTLILGSGGTSLTAVDVVRENGGIPVVVSRTGENHYQNLHLHRDASYIINTTPLGMYPNPHAQAVDLREFPHLEAVLDVVYNPLRTQLLMQAEELGIPCEGGLSMLIYQGVQACEMFQGKPIMPERIVEAERSLRRSVTNLVLIGMPGCGKSTIGKKLAELLHMPLVDIDAEIENRCGCKIKELIESEGEKYFRDLESEVIRDVSSESCLVISTGGGAILREENVRNLRKNGKIFFLNAKLSRLRATDDRPLSNTEDKLAKLYDERMDIYKKTADVTVPDMETPEAEAEYILAKRMELIS